ncbi:MAG TPA: serine hydrolase domain-containing protein [Longimicrobiales bacterium]|nr:serine hydrolase domain-containing protein [Longimicrobiales bacterium]
MPRAFPASIALLALGLLAGPASAEPHKGSDRFARVDSIIEAAIRDGATPGAALAIGRRGAPPLMRAYGRIDWDPESARVTDSTLYDLASLTKVVGTTTAAMMLVQQRRLKLDAPVWRYLSQWPRKGAKGRITIRQLLLHKSGLAEGAELWWIPGSRAERLRWIASRPLASKPGTRTLYSDLGMIVLGSVIERITHTRLDGFLDARVFQPLGMRDTKFNPLNPRNGSPFDLARIAPTELDTSIRNKHLQGEVQDLTAAALGGVAGHAGLFSSIRDLSRFAQVILTGASGKDTKILRASTIERFLAARPGTDRTLGWELAGDDRPFSKVAVGHTGYTGTSIWIDPRRGYYVVLLTNRVDPTAANRKHLALRKAVNEAVSELMAGDDDD